MPESINNMTNSHALSVGDALGITVSAAEARRDQYQDLSDHKGVEGATEELWDVGVTEAKNMSELITSALDVLNEHRDAVLDAKPPRVANMDLRGVIKRLLDDVEYIAERCEDNQITSGIEAAAKLHDLVDSARRRVLAPAGDSNDAADALAYALPRDLDKFRNHLQAGDIFVDHAKGLDVHISGKFPRVPQSSCLHPADARRSLKPPHSGDWCDMCGKIL